MGKFVESTKEASRGGFQGIKKVRGLLVGLEKVPPPEGWETTKEQIKVELEDVRVLEMFPGEEEFELKDDKLSFFVSYAEPGKTPHANSAYMKVWVASAERLGKKPSQFVGEYVTLDKIPTVLFKQPKLGPDKKVLLGPDGKKLYDEISVTTTFGFVLDEASNTASVTDYLKSLVVGLNEKAALRKLLVDTRAKQYPEYKDALNAGTLATRLGLTIVDGKFADANSNG